MTVNHPEIILGLVAPAGSLLDQFTASLETEFKKFGYEIKPIKMIEPTLVMKEISRLRAENPNKRIVYLIDPLKKNHEYDLLTKVYGENYIQVSCFSNQLSNNEKCNKKDKINDKYRQEISELFGKSYFFVNLDIQNPSIHSQARKIVQLLFGVYEEYPTPEEFGMAIANAVSKRSNFPGTRHVGAAIFRQSGEIISCGSIRAPVSHANPTRKDQDAIQSGYDHLKSRRKDYKAQIKNSNITEHADLVKFIDDSMEHHPCTHAEMSAILDAAKMGISTRDTILFSTTFPCHMCAKDIISSGISKVVFLETFPKSKNETLYSNVIEVNPSYPPENKVPFFTFVGVGPRKYHYFFGTENKQPDEVLKGLNQDQWVPPLLKWRTSDFYREVERQQIKTKGVGCE